jgi:hypothetical protein
VKATLLIEFKSEKMIKKQKPEGKSKEEEIDPNLFEWKIKYFELSKN